MIVNQTWETRTGGGDGATSPRLLRESEEDLLAATERAGHEEAPMTGPTSEAAAPPLEGLFQTGFFPALPSGFSSPAAGGGDASAIGSIGGFDWGEDGAAAAAAIVGTESPPRTIRVQGEETWGEGRRDWAAEEEEELGLVEVAEEAMIDQKN